MARPLRLEFAGAVYHVVARGHERGAIFREDTDRERFISELSRRVEEERWVIHAYCLMTNHYHLLIETPQANLVSGMQRLNARYSQAFNFFHRRKGHLLEDRYKATLVEKESYLLELCRYVVLNPVRAGIARSARGFRWSSYRATAGEIEPPSFLTVNGILERFGRDKAQAKEAYRRFVAEGKGSGEEIASGDGQAFLGSAAFLAQMERRLREAEVSPEVPRAQRVESFVELAAVIQVVAEEYHVERDGLKDAWRRGEEKAVAAYLARKLTGRSGREVGEALGVSAARVSQMVKLVEESADAKLERRVKRLREKLGG